MRARILQSASKQEQSGFTLIELMITVVIVSILAAIAFPSYTSFVQKGRRSAAKTTLLQMYARQENYFANVKAYASSATQLNYPSNPVNLNSQGEAQATADSDTVYVVTINLSSNFEYTITATAKGKQAQDTQCASFSIDQLGNKTASSPECW